MGGACSTGHQMLLQTPLGVHLQDTKEVRASMPNGTHPCTCGPPKPEGKFRKSVEFLETESKGVVEYNFDRKQSGWTKGISKFVVTWLHSDNSDIPKALRKMKPDKEGWVWDEQWHSSKWILYSDPYSHSKHRFRMWRRLAKAGGAWTEEENTRIEDGSQNQDMQENQREEQVEEPQSPVRRKSHDETRIPTPANGSELPEEGLNGVTPPPGVVEAE